MPDYQLKACQKACREYGFGSVAELKAYFREKLGQVLNRHWFKGDGFRWCYKELEAELLLIDIFLGKEKD